MGSISLEALDPLIPAALEGLAMYHITTLHCDPQGTLGTRNGHNPFNTVVPAAPETVFTQ